MAKVVLYGDIHPAGKAVLARRDDISVVIVAGTEPAEFDREIGGADAVILRYFPFGRDQIARANRLSVVSRYGVGYDNVDLDALNDRGIPLTVVGDVNAVAVAEQALYLMLCVAKQGIQFDAAIRAGNWARRDGLGAIELWQKQVLVIGMGRIGRRVAALCAAFGMAVRVSDPPLGEATIRAAGFDPVTSLDDDLAAADFVTVHVPLSDDTRNLIDAKALARMKPEAVLVNTARGGLVEEAALCKALGEGHLHGAGLDVFAVEPPAADNPLFAFPNTVLMPHNAGLSRESAARMALAAAQNALDGIDGRLDPELVINREVLA